MAKFFGYRFEQLKCTLEKEHHFLYEKWRDLIDFLRYCHKEILWVMSVIHGMPIVWNAEWIFSHLSFNYSFVFYAALFVQIPDMDSNSPMICTSIRDPPCTESERAPCSLFWDYWAFVMCFPRMVSCHVLFIAVWSFFTIFHCGFSITQNHMHFTFMYWSKFSKNNLMNLMYFTACLALMNQQKKAGRSRIREYHKGRFCYHKSQPKWY